VADAARHDVDLGALLPGAIQLLDDLLVGRLFLDRMRAFFAVGGRTADLTDAVQQALP